MTPQAPQLSVVVATTEPWPAVAACLARLLPQVEALGGELILADSSGAGLGVPRVAGFERVLWQVQPGASVFRLRAEAVAAARGDVVAWTEDHCVPATDWCERTLEAHRERPEIGAVGGGVLNGSRRSVMDWASYLLTFGPVLPPLETSRIERMPTVANASFKRAVLPPTCPEAGWFELHLLPRLWRQGAVAFDERVLVEHVQSNGWLGTPRMHYHNGRSTSGLAVAAMSEDERRARIRRCFILPKEILRTTLRTVAGKRSVRRPLIAAFPFMVLLAASHAVGEWVGLLRRSPGKSPERLL